MVPGISANKNFYKITFLIMCGIFFYRINVGLTVIAAGFGDIKRGLKLWVYQLCVAMMFYPLLKVYAWTGKITRTYSGKYLTTLIAKT